MPHRAGPPGALGRPRLGTPVAPQLVGVNHSHHFNFRLDLDVDGPLNSFVLRKLEKSAAIGPRQRVWAGDSSWRPARGEGCGEGAREGALGARTTSAGGGGESHASTRITRCGR